MSGETVLVIDDSPTILKVVQLVLTKAGYNVRTAADGDEGIDAAKERRPDVILLDFVMPKVNGYQVCQALHQEEELRDVPVILMSAKGDQVGDRFVKVMGIVDYITKPFSPEAVTGIVRHTIDKYHKKAPREDASVPAADAMAAAEAAEAATEARKGALGRLREGISRAVARAVLDGLSELAADVAADQDDVATWVARGLTREQLEILLGELRASAPELTGSDSDAALTGDLRVVPLAEVLLLLSQQQQTGGLVVTRGNAQVELHFEDGQIQLGTAAGVPSELLLGRFIVESNLMTQEELDAVIDSRPGSASLLGAQLVKAGHVDHDDLRAAIRQQTCELVYEMLRWNFGKFTFRPAQEPTAVARDAALGLSVDGILMEGFRRVDEWHLIEKEIDNFDLVFLRNEDAVSRMGRGRLTREELAILELVNGKNTVKEIVRQSRMGSFEVSKMLYRLHSIKLIRKRVQPVAV